MKSKYIVSVFFILMLMASVSAQIEGDEDVNMQNQARRRDKAAINEAMNGWWKESQKTCEERIEWWSEARFGMFVHWGVYSVPGGEWNGDVVSGYSEHLMRKKKIPVTQYQEELVVPFNPVEFNADDWIRRAHDAGMKYFIITAKHHDGFAMYDSDVSDYNIVKSSKYHKDPMKELSDACKKYGLKFGFYYSHAFDWEDPNAPGNDWDYNNPGGDLNLFGGRYWYDIHPELLPKAVKYVDTKAIPQIKELIVKYNPDILWFDTPHKLPFSENIKILQKIREIDTDVVINGRLARTKNLNFGDYKNTADRPSEFFPVSGNWEAIPTTNESYGYSRYDNSHKSASFFIQLLAKAASRGGNILLNIGPMGNGKIDPRDTVILSEIGQWMVVNGESIWGTQKSELPLQNWGVCTQKNNRLYLHVFEWPKDGKLIVGGLKTSPEKVWLLEDRNKNNLQFKKCGDLNLQIKLPNIPTDTINTVLVLDMGESIIVDSIRLLTSKDVNRLLAFDATLNGTGFRYGDGKFNRYYIDGWNKKEQSISWCFRLNKSVEAELSIRYRIGKNSGGTASVTVAGQVMPLEIKKTNDKMEIRTSIIGHCYLPEGVHRLIIQPESIFGDCIMQPFEINIIPKDY